MGDRQQWSKGLPVGVKYSVLCPEAAMIGTLNKLADRGPGKSAEDQSPTQTYLLITETKEALCVP